MTSERKPRTITLEFSLLLYDHISDEAAAEFIRRCIAEKTFYGPVSKVFTECKLLSNIKATVTEKESD